MALTIDEGNPIIVTGTTAANEVIIDKGLGGALMVKFIKWHKPTTIGHLCTIKDSNGRVVVPFDCEVADESQWAPIWSYFQNLYCDDMDSGELYIYTK